MSLKTTKKVKVREGTIFFLSLRIEVSIGQVECDIILIFYSFFLHRGVCLREILNKWL